MILRFAIIGDDSYIHFVSRYKDTIKDSDGNTVTYKKAPDHISYHRDGKVHIKFKDGTYHDVPLNVPEKHLTNPVKQDLLWIAISFYEEGFKEHAPFFKLQEKKPDKHVIIESNNVTFTILIRSRDLSDIPLDRRTIDFEVRVGGIIPDKPYPNLIDSETIANKQFPIFNACLNPTEDMMQNLKLFSEEEVRNAGKFNEFLSQTFGLYR